MYLDTRSQEKMMLSLVKGLNASYTAIQLFFLENRHLCHTQGWCDGALLENRIQSFVEQHISNISFDEVLFFHLSRRLNTVEDNLVDNLFNLLSTENAFSKFLNMREIAFVSKNRRLELYFKGEHFPLKESYGVGSGIHYLRWRLGHNKKGNKDFCVNGFAFKDLVYRNDYAQSLMRAPEFICNLSDFLEMPQLISDYERNSKYYCFEYCVPLDEVIIDENAKLKSNIGKVKHLLQAIVRWLYECSVCGEDKITANGNPVLRLKDTATMLEKHFVGKEEINRELLMKA